MRPISRGCFPLQRQLLRRRLGSAQPIVLALVAFILGITVAAFWLRRPAKTADTIQSAPQLSDGTKSVLSHLDRPVEIRFYSVLDPNAGAGLSDLSHHAEQLLSAFEQQGNGKIAVVLFDSQTNASLTSTSSISSSFSTVASAVNAALEDGIQGFGPDSGSYLGVALICGQKREVLPQLMPQWGSALESDLARAIARIAEPDTTRPIVSQSAAQSEAAQEVKSQIPNYTDVSLEEGTRRLREASLKEFTAIVTEMQAQVQEAQKQLQQAQSGSTSDQEAAAKHLQDLQNAQAQKLKEIAAKSHAQIEAWKQLKAAK